MRLPDIALATAEQHSMFPVGSPVVAMVSGGADSVAALHLLAAGVLGDLPVRVLHVNHLLRGEESDADEAFVRALGERLGFDVRVLRYDIAAYAENEGLNLEDAGRRVRYRFAEEELDAWCAQQDTSALRGRIVVAHTLDDRVETFFMRALFGSGSGGLASIAPTRGRIVRPLLGVERSAIREWLRDRGEAWREDDSNADTSRLRANIRATLLPPAEQVNPGFRTALARTMDLLAADDALLTSMAEAFARDFADIRFDEEVAFNRDLMSTLDPTMLRRTLRVALLKTFPGASRIEAEHIEALIRGVASEHFSHDLPGGLRAFGEYGKMVVSRSDVALATVAPSLLMLPGTADLGGAGRIAAEYAQPGETQGTPESVVVDVGLGSAELIVDSVRPGDRMRPLGMDGSRKLSDLLIDAKVPKRARGLVPVIRDGERIVWLAGVRMSEDYRVTAATTRPFRLTWQREGESVETPAYEDRSSKADGSASS